MVAIAVGDEICTELSRVCRKLENMTTIKRRGLLALLHHQGALLLGLLHLGLLITVGLPQASMKHLGSSVVHLLPAVEAAALAQRADGVREGMVHLRLILFGTQL